MPLGSVTAKNLDLASNYGSSHSSAWPNTIYLALFTGNPASSGVELDSTIGGYARLAINNDATNFPAPSAGVLSNGVNFSMYPSTDAWSATADYWAFMDLATAGSVFDCGLVVASDLVTPAPITVTGSGYQVVFAAGSLQISN